LAIRRHKLEYRENFDFLLFGISSHENDYRLVWKINHDFSLNFVRNDNLKVISKKTGKELEFPLYSYDDEDTFYLYHLVANKSDQGVLLEELKKEVGKKQGKTFDPFDLICHVAFDRPPLSRRERAEQIKKRDVFTKYGAQAQRVLAGLLEKYADAGIQDIEDIKILTLDPFNQLGTPQELVSAFGGKPAYLKAIHDLEQQLYA